MPSASPPYPSLRVSKSSIWLLSLSPGLSASSETTARLLMNPCRLTSEKLPSLSILRALRVWLPSRRPSRLRLLESLFQLPTLLGFSLQSFSLIQGSTVCFQTLFHSCASLQTLSALNPRFSGLISPHEPFPCLLPGVFPQVRAVCSLEFLHLSGLTSRALSKASPFTHALSAFQPNRLSAT